VHGFGGSNGHVRIQILASLNSFAIYGCETSLSIRSPSINSVSSKLAPVLPSILIKSKLTSFLSKSATYKTALTAYVASFLLHLLTILEPREIIAA